jgi:DNA processing protein
MSVPMNMPADPYLLALCSLPLLGPVTQRRLIRAFGSPEKVFRAPAAELSRVEGVSTKRAGSIAGYDRWDALKKGIERVRAQGTRIVTFDDAGQDSGYPEALRALGEDAPLVLYIKGEVIEEDRFAVAMVGSRTPTPYGKNAAETLSEGLAGMGLTVVSGLARGIDTAAHIAAVRTGGRSMAVLGAGMDVPYPPENRGLLERLTHSGAVITEFPPGTPPLRENFPRRNRLISGLSLGVLVVEAAEKSGALITAEHALEQGKEVFAVPGNITSAVSEGTNRLIRQGARMVGRAEDVLEELAPQLRGFVRREAHRPPVELTDPERAVCDIMTREPRHVDDIGRASGLSAPAVLSVLLSLELKGAVRQTEGKRFHLV